MRKHIASHCTRTLVLKTTLPVCIRCDSSTHSKDGFDHQQNLGRHYNPPRSLFLHFRVEPMLYRAKVQIPGFTLSQANIPTTDGVVGRRRNTIISARQYRHNVPFIHGWNIHYNPSSMLMPVQAAAVALTTMYDAILQAENIWAALPSPGAFSIRFGNYLRVHFHPAGIEMCPRYLVEEMIWVMRDVAQAGFVSPFSVMLQQGATMVFVWVDVLPGIGGH